MLPQLRVVIRRWRSRAAEPVRRILESLRQRLPRLPLKGLQDTALIQHHPGKLDALKVFQLLVVRDEYAGTIHIIPAAHHLRGDAKLARLCLRLPRHRKRRQDQHTSPRMLCHLMRPLQLLDRLPQPAVLKERSPPLPDRPADHVLLPRKKRCRKRPRFKAAFRQKA